MYNYQLLKQDGSTEDLGTYPKTQDFEQFREWLNCSTIEIIPADYYQLEWGEVTVFGDEEGRFNSNNKRNPHTKVLGEHWDCVGDLIMETELK